MGKKLRRWILKTVDSEGNEIKYNMNGLEDLEEGIPVINSEVINTLFKNIDDNLYENVSFIELTSILDPDGNEMIDCDLNAVFFRLSDDMPFIGLLIGSLKDSGDGLVIAVFPMELKEIIAKDMKLLGGLLYKLIYSPEEVKELVLGIPI